MRLPQESAPETSRPRDGPVVDIRLCPDTFGAPVQHAEPAALLPLRLQAANPGLQAKTFLADFSAPSVPPLCALCVNLFLDFLQLTID